METRILLVIEFDASSMLKKSPCNQAVETCMFAHDNESLNHEMLFPPPFFSTLIVISFYNQTNKHRNWFFFNFLKKK